MTGHGIRDVSHLLGHARVGRHLLSYIRVPQPRIRSNRHQDRVCSICIRRNTTGHGNRDFSVTF